MSLILTQPITGPSAWKAADLANSDAWIYRLSPDAIATLDAALASVKARGLSFPGFGKADFPIESLAAELNRWSEELENGLGFLLVRGLPAERYSDEDFQILTYGIGLHLGRPVRQNPKGDLLGNVAAVGDINDKHTRVYETNLYLPYHTDPSDVVGLMCVRKASEGGLSSLVSTAAVYNQILEQHREYLGLYYKRWYMAHLCQPDPAVQLPRRQAELPLPAPVHRAGPRDHGPAAVACGDRGTGRVRLRAARPGQPSGHDDGAGRPATGQQQCRAALAHRLRRP